MAADESPEQYLVEPSLVTEYLSSNPSVPPAFRNPKDVQKLSGGSGNFVYRLHLTPGDDTAGCPETVVLKHSAPFVAAWPALAFDIDRWEVEKAALPVSDKIADAKPSLLQDLKTAHIKIPSLYFSDPEKKVLIIEDAGETAVSLKQLIAREKPLSEKLMQDIGKELGEWLALLHTTTSTTNDGKMEITQEYRDSFESTTARNMCAWRTFGRLKESMTVWDPKYEYNDHNAGEKGGSEEELEMIAAKVHQEVMRDSHCVTMGDFWTGNVLVRLKGDDDEVDTIYIVDWELAHPGDPATDVAQMTAEMFCSYTFANSDNATAAKALAQKFHESYCEAAKSAETQAGLRGRVMLHAGAHVALWVGLVGWTEDAAKITEARNAGMDMLWEGSKGGGEAGDFCGGLTN